MILTDEEITSAYCKISDDQCGGREWAIGGLHDAAPFARTIEAAVLKKLREQEPVAWADLVNGRISTPRTKSFADEHEVALFLHPSADAVHTARLREAYKRFISILNDGPDDSDIAHAFKILDAAIKGEA